MGPSTKVAPTIGSAAAVARSRARRPPLVPAVPSPCPATKEAPAARRREENTLAMPEALDATGAAHEEEVRRDRLRDRRD